MLGIMKKYLYLYFLTWFTSHALDYCSVSLDHTMCRFGEEIGHSCGQYSSGGVSKSEIDIILKEHNNYRRKIAKGLELMGSPGPQPSAANMYELVWDDRLADVAQRWADQCTFRHDKCRHDPHYKVGQNIYWSSGIKEVNWTRAIQAWYEEVNYVNSSDVNSFQFNYNTAHYAQLAWATTRRIGCGRRTYGDSYRIVGDKPLEHILSEVATSVSNVTGDKEDKDLAEEIRREAGYFGAKELGFDSGIKSTTIVTKENVMQTEDILVNRILKQEPGFFGGVNFDSFGNQDIIANSVSKSASKVTVIDKELQLAGELSKNSSESSEESDGDEVNEKNHGRLPENSKLRLYTNDDGSNVMLELIHDNLLICNYGPTGNIPGEPIYESGTPCNCPDYYASCRDGLCVSFLDF